MLTFGFWLFALGIRLLGKDDFKTQWRHAFIKLKYVVIQGLALQSLP